MMKEGKDINELMEMPFSFFMELVEEEAEKKVTKTTSMIDAFMQKGGTQWQKELKVCRLTFR